MHDSLSRRNPSRVTIDGLAGSDDDSDHDRVVAPRSPTT
jgi:hypothetical protein